MTPRPHGFAEADFAAVARGGGGVTAVRALVAARRSRTLLLIRFLIGANPAARQAFEVLAEVRRVAPDAVDRVLDHPSVGAWATRTALRLSRGLPARPEELAYVAAAAAVRGGVRATLSFPPVESACLPSLGTLRRRVVGPTSVRELDWDPPPRLTMSDGVSFPLDRWPGGSLPAALPVAYVVDVAAWQDRISAGWDLLLRHHGEVARELREAVTVLTPLRSADGGSSSATLADAFGCVFLSLAPDAESVAVTLAHEVQHTKLVALMDLFPLLESDHREVFYAPWRNDPRPVAGLLHGTYAYVGVTGFWRRQRRNSAGGHAHVEFARWRAAALETTRTLLGSGGLTDLGRRFVSGMAEVLTEWCAEPVPAEALATAERLSREHRAQWATSRPAGRSR